MQARTIDDLTPEWFSSALGSTVTDVSVRVERRATTILQHVRKIVARRVHSRAHRPSVASVESREDRVDPRHEERAVGRW